MGNWRYWVIGLTVVYYFFRIALESQKPPETAGVESTPVVGFHAETFHNLCQTNYSELVEQAQTQCLSLGWNSALGRSNDRNN